MPRIAASEAFQTKRSRWCLESSNWQSYPRRLRFDGTLCWKAEHYGKLIPMQCMRTGTAEVIVPMTDREIAALERVRDGGAAVFQIRLRAIGFLDDTNTIGVYAPVSFHYQDFKYQDFKVHLEKWHEVLRGFGFGDFRVVERPAPPAESSRGPDSRERSAFAGRCESI
jgi:hypothetical protein